MFEKLRAAITQRTHREEQTAGKKYSALIGEAIEGRLDSPKNLARVEQTLAECGRSFAEFEADVARRQRMLDLETVAKLEAARKKQVDSLNAQFQKMEDDEMGRRKVWGDDREEVANEAIAAQRQLDESLAARQALETEFASESNLGSEAVHDRQTRDSARSVTAKEFEIRELDEKIRSLKLTVDRRRPSGYTDERAREEQTSMRNLYATLDRNVALRKNLAQELTALTGELVAAKKAKPQPVAA